MNIVRRRRRSLSYVTGAHALQGRVQQPLGPSRPAARLRRPTATSYRFNNGVPNQITERAVDLRDRSRRRPGGAGHLRAGQVDGQAADAERRASASTTSTRGFPEFHLGPGPLVPNRNITFPEIELVPLQGHLAAPRRGLRPVRQRQDRAQGELRPLHGGPSIPLDGNPMRDRLANRVTRTLDRRQQQLHPRLRSDQPAGAGSPAERRRLLRHDLATCASGRPFPSTTYDPDDARGLGQARRTTGSSRPASSTS